LNAFQLCFQLGPPHLERSFQVAFFKAIVTQLVIDSRTPGVPLPVRETSAFAVDGKQYVAIAAGSALYTFGLP
jgi:hypothetical protein